MNYSNYKSVEIFKKENNVNDVTEELIEPFWNFYFIVNYIKRLVRNSCSKSKYTWENWGWSKSVYYTQKL